MALRDYQRKSGVPCFCLALSGGRDSAMVALLVQRMFRYANPALAPDALRALIHDRFVCAYMATENSGGLTRAAARAVAEDVGARFFDGDIQASLDSAQATIAAMTGAPMRWDNPAHDIPLQNIQARLRGMLIWTVANLYNALLLVTSNKSEAAVGYTTMDGDSSGGLAPIADVPKSLVSLYLAWAHRFHSLAGLSHILALQASAELRPQEKAQTDEDDLMPFFILDQLMYAFVQQGLDPLEMLQRLWPSLRDHYRGDLGAFAAHVRKFVRLFCFAQWKRERFAISFRVTAFDLDPKTGYRFPAVQAPFTEELAAMDAFVAQSLSDPSAP
jgi:NAD+ synthase (glutamine-hydrolysing)